MFYLETQKENPLSKFTSHGPWHPQQRAKRSQGLDAWMQQGGREGCENRLWVPRKDYRAKRRKCEVWLRKRCKQVLASAKTKLQREEKQWELQRPPAGPINTYKCLSKQPFNDTYFSKWELDSP